jgi:hypothetical protein
MIFGTWRHNHLGDQYELEQAFIKNSLAVGWILLVLHGSEYSTRESTWYPLGHNQLWRRIISNWRVYVRSTGCHRCFQTSHRIYFHMLNLWFGWLLKSLSTLTRGRVSSVELMLWPKVSRPIRLGVGRPFEVHDQLLFFPFFCRTTAFLFVFGRPLWWEDGSTICSAICQYTLYITYNIYRTSYNAHLVNAST